MVFLLLASWENWFCCWLSQALFQAVVLILVPNVVWGWLIFWFPHWCDEGRRWRLQRGCCSTSLAAPARILPLTQPFLAVSSLVFTHTQRQWLLSTMTKTGAIAHVKHRTQWCRIKTWLTWLNLKEIRILLGQELTRQAWMKAFQGQRKDMAEMWQIRMVFVPSCQSYNHFATALTDPHMGRGLIQSGLRMFQRWSPIS